MTTRADIPELEELRVLVADDSGAVRRILRSMLARYGASNVLEAADGREAWAMLQREPVDVVVADRNMPGLDGQELLERVRAEPELADTPFLMITQEAGKESVLEAIRAGVTDYLLKPVSAPALFSKINEVRERRRGPARVLVVDDSEAARMLLTAMLQSQGDFEIHAAASGEEALKVLDRLARRTPEALPDLVLMDIIMPGQDGVEAVWSISLDERLRFIPVIMVSARDEEESLQHAFEAGAADYLAKPVSRVELGARVRSALRLKSERDQRMRRERELLARLDELQEVVCFDPGTRTLNHRAFKEALRREWGRCVRDKRSLGVILLELVGWKELAGREDEAAEKALRETAAAASGRLKRHGDVLARIEPGRLAVLLPETGRAGTAAVAGEILEALPEAVAAGGGGLALAAGTAWAAPDSSLDSQALLQAADMALYEALERGGGLVEREVDSE
jgi:diguanylate cyclase (GGDEF)-like protein